MSRISPGTLLIAAVAIASGLVGASIVRDNLNSRRTPIEQAAESPAERFNVPRAGTDLQAGRTITLGDIAIVQMTREQMRESGIASAYMNQSSQIIGRVLRNDLAKGATFDLSSFYPEGTGPHIAELLESGMRAVTVPVAFDARAGGFATPGTWVDVVFRSDSFTRDSSKREESYPSVAITLLQRVKVLAVEQNVTEESRIGNRAGRDDQAAVTLQVNPDEAQSLRLIEGRGTLALILRNPNDLASSSTAKPLSMEQLLNLPSKVNYQMEVYRGNRISRVDFEGETGTRKADTLIAGNDSQPSGNSTNLPQTRHSND